MNLKDLLRLYKIKQPSGRDKDRKEVNRGLKNRNGRVYS